MLVDFHLSKYFNYGNHFRLFSLCEAQQTNNEKKNAQQMEKEALKFISIFKTWSN